MFGRAAILLAILASALAVPAAAQPPGPTTTAFDGKYAGVSREMSKSPSAPRAKCTPSGVPAPLTITNGIIRSTGGSWEGTVNPQGTMVMRNSSAARIDAQIDSQGTIRGQYSGTGCIQTYVWQKASQ